MPLTEIAAGAVGLGVLAAGIYNGWVSVQVKRLASRAETTTAEVSRSLHTSNGGSHVKDQLDQLVSGMKALRTDSQQLRADFREHREDSRHRHERTEVRLDALEHPDATACAVIPFSERTTQ